MPELRLECLTHSDIEQQQCRDDGGTDRMVDFIAPIDGVTKWAGNGKKKPIDIVDQ